MKFILLVLVLITWCDCRINGGFGDDQTPNGAKCLPGEFQCESKDQCILELRRCDGISDCRDKSDEENCVSDKLPRVGPISGDSYRRSDRHMWPVFILNLPNSSFVSSPISIFPQESTKDCTKYEYKCNGKCFPLAIICNGSKECGDGSDEKDCPSTSTPLDLSTSSHPPTKKLTPTNATTNESSTVVYPTTVEPSSTTNATTAKPNTAIYPTTVETSRHTTTHPTTTEPSTTTTRACVSSKSLNVTSKDERLPMEKQQLAIDSIVLAFDKYEHNDYWNISSYIRKAFVDKYQSQKWMCSVGIHNSFNIFHIYKPPHQISIYAADVGVKVDLWENLY